MNKPTLPDQSEAQPAEAGLGHNNPPAFDAAEVAQLTERADEFLSAADIWRQQDVTSEILSAQLTDMISGLRENRKTVEDARKAAKKPHDDAGKAVQGAYLPILERYDRALKVLLGKMNDWLQKKEAEERERKRKEQEEAEAKAAEARRLEMEAAQSGSIDAEIAAEAAKKEAAKAEKIAAKPVKAQAKSASGVGRTVSQRSWNEVTIANNLALFMHYRDRPEVNEVLLRLANAEANAAGFGGHIPGTTIEKKTKAV